MDQLQVKVYYTVTNTAPSGTDNTITINEDASHTFAAGDFGFTDPDAGDTMSAVRIDTLPGAGSLTLSAVPVTAGQVILTANIPNLLFTPAANANGSPYASFTFSVRDTGGPVYDTTPNTMTFNVTAADDPSVAVDDTATVAEDAAATAINVRANDTDIEDGFTTELITAASDPANGTVVITGGGTGLTYAPDLNYCAAAPTTDDFTYTLAGGDTATVAVTVTCVDDPSVAVDDTATVAEDAAATAINVRANDTDIEDGFTTELITAASDPANGTVVITGGGTGLTYAPDLNYCAAAPTTDDFTYTLAGGDTATVAVTVTCVDDAPVAVNDSATLPEDVPATTFDVLANDTDVDGGPKLIGSVDTTGTNGTVLITSGGTRLTYQPNLNYCNNPPGTTPDTFTYTIAPGGSTATVSVTINCVNDPSVAVDDTATFTEDDPATAIPVRANDTDVEDGFTNELITAASDPANGTVVITGGGTGLTYQPDANYCAAAPTTDDFTYTLAGGDTATVAVTVTCVDDSSVAVDDTATFTEDDPAAAINVRANDTDIEDGFTTELITAASDPANGTVVITGGGTGLTYQPDLNYCAAAPATDDFTYTLAGGDTATVRVTVNCVDDPPTAVDDAPTVAEDSGPNTIDVLVNDTDIDGGPMTITGVTQPANGTIVNNGTDLTYEPDANYCTVPPATDNFTYTLNGGSSATVRVTVTCVDDPPTAVDDTATVTEDDPATTINVLVNDTDIDAGPMTITGVTQPANGTVVNNGTDLTYEPDANYCTVPPATDNFTYTLNGGSSATVRVTVTCVDDASVAVDDTPTVGEDAGATTINVRGNDIDIDGAVELIQSVTQPANGTVVITNGGLDLTYAPNLNYCAAPPATDDFTYTLAGGSSATVAVTVTCADDPPTAVDDTATFAEDDPATAIDVLVNDTDIDGGPMSIASVTQPANGTVAITGGGTGLTYQPAANYCAAPPATDDFTYTLNGGSTATVRVTVTCVDDPPTAVDDTATFAEDDPATAIDVLFNDTDIDGGPMSIASVTQPANGTVVNNGTDLTYEPDANYCAAAPATDDFTYTLNGGSSATVRVEVTCVDDAPTAVDDAPTVAEDSGPNTIDVLNNDTDIDGGPMTITAVTQPANGTVVNNGTDLTYEPDANYCAAAPATDDFTYTLNGGSEATVRVTVNCTNDASVAVDDFATISEDAPATTIDVRGNDTDVDTAVENIISVTQPANGTVAITNSGVDLTYTPNANYCSANEATDNFTYTLESNIDPTSTATVHVFVDCVNDEPDFTASNPPPVLINAGAQTIPSWVTSFTPGPADESWQTVLAYHVSNSTCGTLLSVQPAVATDGTLTFTPAANQSGTCTFDVQVQDDGGAQNPGDDDTGPAHTFTITINDNAPPIVVTNGIGSTPDTGDGHISENEIVWVNLVTLSVTFSEDMFNPAGNTNPSDVTNPSNYMLLWSQVNGFATTTCAGGVQAPDKRVPITSVIYTNNNGQGPYKATLTFNTLLPNGFYRLIVCGTTSVMDLAGNKLAGNGTLSGTDFTRNFMLFAGGGGGGGGGTTPSASGTIPTTGFAPGRVTTLTGPRLNYASSTVTIELPRLKMTLPVVGVPFKNGGWDVNWLTAQAGWLEHTAFPGLNGNSVLTSHITSPYGSAGPFANLGKMVVGDLIYVRNNGTLYIFEVEKIFTVNPNDTSIFKHEEKPWLTLVTCQEWDEMLGTYLKRLVVRARLIGTMADPAFVQ